jgi:hypothetical protein
MWAKLNTAAEWKRGMDRIVLNRHIQISLIFGFSIAVGMLTTIVLPDGGRDMTNDILPCLSNWRAPWKEGTPLLPWSVMILMPLRLFSGRIATVIINSLSVILTAISIKRLGGNILLTLPVLFSPIGYWLFTTGQTDALVLAGFLFLPAGLDLLFFWKPQMILHAYWIRLLKSPIIYAIVGAVILAASFLIWGNWPLAIYHFADQNLIAGWWNRAVWPYGIPLGAYFVYQSIRKKDESFGIVASPLLSPYVNGPSYLGMAVVVAIKWPRLFFFVYAAFWLYFFYRRLGS